MSFYVLEVVSVLEPPELSKMDLITLTAEQTLTFLQTSTYERKYELLDLPAH